jgi:hypothetical protein
MNNTTGGFTMKQNRFLMKGAVAAALLAALTMAAALAACGSLDGGGPPTDEYRDLDEFRDKLRNEHPDKWLYEVSYEVTTDDHSRIVPFFFFSSEELSRNEVQDRLDKLVADKVLTQEQVQQAVVTITAPGETASKAGAAEAAEKATKAKRLAAEKTAEAKRLAAEKAAKARDFLAKGAAAEGQEQFGIALYWYYSANNYDPTLPEAAQRAAALEAKIKSGNPWGVTGNNSIEVKIETDKRWPVLRKQTEDYFKANNPFLEDGNLIIDSRLQLHGTTGRVSHGFREVTINLEAGTVTYVASPLNDTGGFLGMGDGMAHFDSWKGLINNDAAFRAMKAMGSTNSQMARATHYLFQAELVNGKGKVIATTPEPPATISKFQSGDWGNRYIYELSYSIRGQITRTKLTWNPGWQAFVAQDFFGGAIFTVPIADVTDEGMTARILKVYQYSDPDETGGVFKLLKTTVVK